MKNYYKILGVNLNAHDADIKRAFRKLAIQYHPDKNPDPSAEVLFKEINEAYEVLSDPQKKAGYDWRIQNPLSDSAQETTKPTHRDPAYHSTGSKRSNVKSERERLFEMMIKYLPIIKRSSVICFSLSAFLLVDYILPNRLDTEKIIKTYSHSNSIGRYSNTYHVILTNENHEIELPFELLNYFQVDDDITLYSSLILHVKRTVEGNGIVVTMRRSIYGNFIFAPMTLLIISFLALVFSKDVERSFNYGIISLLILILNGLIISLL